MNKFILRLSFAVTLIVTTFFYSFAQEPAKKTDTKQSIVKTTKAPVKKNKIAEKKFVQSEKKSPDSANDTKVPLSESSVLTERNKNK